MILKLDMNSTVPIYVQLRNQIVMGIGHGELKEGERLPTVRQLASDAGVNTMTVNKTDRRQGAMVARNITMNKEFREKLESELELLSAEACINGMDKSEFMKMCESIYSTMNPQPLQA